MISLVRQRLLNPTINFQLVRTILTNSQIGVDRFLKTKEVNLGLNKGNFDLKMIY